MSTHTALQTIEVHPAGDAVASIIVLHGLGADGTDFLPFADQIDLSSIGPVRWLLPRAPERAVTVNNGYRMRAWYDIFPPTADADMLRREDEPGLRASQTLIQQLIDREAALGVPAHRVVLMGFSQGCAMTLMTGLRAPQRLAGLAGLSGYLPLAATTATERSEANRQTPVFLAHGTDDPMVTIDRGEATRDALLALGNPVDWHTYPMEHSVCPEEVEDLNRWLLRVLA